MDWLVNFSADKYLTTFLTNNLLTIGALMVAVKSLAKITKWNWDNMVADFLETFFNALTSRGRK